MPSSVIYGRHPVTEVLRAGRRKVMALFYVSGESKFLMEILSLAREMGVPARPADARELSRKCRSETHQGVAVEVMPPAMHDLPAFIKRIKEDNPAPMVAVLDSIVDPQNFGAVLRSAEAFGFAGAVYPRDRSADINSTVVKASAGAAEYLEFCRVTNLSRALETLKEEGFHVVAVEADGETPMNAYEPSFPVAVVMGSEGKGVRPLVRRHCDMAVRIPMKGRVNSLNVSAAAAVVFHHVAKRLG